MTSTRRVSGANTTITTGKRREAGVWVAGQSLKRRLSGAWVTVWAAMQLQARTITQNSTGTTQPSAWWRLSSTGIVQYSSGPSGAATTGETWLVSGANSDYEVRFTKTAGAATPYGTLDTWLACSTTREVGFLAPAQNDVTYSADVLVEIRDKTTLTVLSSATMSLSVWWGTV
jgi:hypothetical protein